MKKVLATTLGVVLAAGAASTLADRQDRAHLTQCKADIESYYGEDTRTRLRSISRTAGETHMRLMVTPDSGGNRVVVCSVSRGDGARNLADGEGVALAPLGDRQSLSLVE
jgi:hypothetical protein